MWPVSHFFALQMSFSAEMPSICYEIGIVWKLESRNAYFGFRVMSEELKEEW
jgi:hypothetical protein